MRKFFATLCIAVLASAVFCESKKPLMLDFGAMPKITELPEGAKTAPWVGEKLTYNIRWGIMVVGEAVIASDSIIDLNGAPCYYLYTKTNSTGLADSFYRVRDKNESAVDVFSLRSRGYTRQIREGKYFRDEWALFQPGDELIIGSKINKAGKAERFSGQMKGEVYDMLSGLYAVRGMDLAVGKEFSITVSTKEIWTLKIKVTGREKVKVPAGKFDCFVLEPQLKEAGLFQQKEGSTIKVWMTADKNHIPVLLQAEVFIGSVSAKLGKITRGDNANDTSRPS